jgi:hypothetical protein
MGGTNFGGSPVAKIQRGHNNPGLFFNQSDQSNMFNGSNVISEPSAGFGLTAGLRDQDRGVEDIEHFFCSSSDDWNTTDWERSQFQQRVGSLGFGSSSSEGNNVIVVDSSAHEAELYPFLLSSPPSTPLGLQNQLQSSPLSSSPSDSVNRIERTSALPLPSVQANNYGNLGDFDFNTMNLLYCY